MCFEPKGPVFGQWQVYQVFQELHWQGLARMDRSKDQLILWGSSASGWRTFRRLSFLNWNIHLFPILFISSLLVQAGNMYWQRRVQILSKGWCPYHGKISLFQIVAASLITAKAQAKRKRDPSPGKVLWVFCVYQKGGTGWGDGMETRYFM